MTNMQAQEHFDPATRKRKIAILPTEEMLVAKDTGVMCPVNCCGKLVRRLATLKHHLEQHSLDPTQCKEGVYSTHPVDLKFHCPIHGCTYNKLSERFFPNIKYLKQHYHKVHAIKHLECPKCGVSFSQQSLLDAHLRQCGHTFKCHCGATYSSREAYLTHTRRKHYEMSAETVTTKRSDSKIQAPAATSRNITEEEHLKKAICLVVVTEKEKISKPRLLLPKPAPINSVPLPTLAAIALSELSVMREACQKNDSGTQTDSGFSSKLHCFCCGDAYFSGKAKRGSGIKRSSTVDLGAYRRLSDTACGTKRLRRSAETQTKGVTNAGRHSKRQKACAETQTLVHLILEKAMAEANLPIVGQISGKRLNRLHCQSIETQTAEASVARTNNCVQAVNETHVEIELGSAYPSPQITSCETQTIWHSLDSDNVGCATNRKMSPLHCDTLASSQSYMDLERSSAGTQTTNTGVLGIGMRQCSSSQTEKDVFLGHMGNPFSSNQAFSPSLLSSTLNSVFSPSCCIPLHQVNSQSETCSMQYADLFPQGSSKLNENRVLSSETQTELNFDMLLNCSGDDEQSSDSILCSNIQTQTTDDLESLSYELLTNMHTQTNEDFLFPELTFSDIQTQTSWKDTVPTNNNHSVSVHIQTQMPESSTQVINMQTQTFVPPLEIGIEFADSHTQTTWSFMHDLISDL